MEILAGTPFGAAVDIEGFFDHVAAEKVEGALVRQGLSEELATLITRITTYRGRLVQGSPTSPALANLVLLESDRRIAAEAQRLGVRVSRYVDDYNIGGRYRDVVMAMIKFIRKELSVIGLQLNEAKTRVSGPVDRKTALGLHLSNAVSVGKRRPAKKGRWSRTQLRDAVRRVERYGATEGELATIRGRIGYVGRLHEGEARSLRERVRKVRIRR